VNTAIWWIRRDLRLHDNPALQAALEGAGQVLPVFVLDPALLRSRYAGEKRTAFLFAGLHALHDDLQARGSYLLIRTGNPVEVLTMLYSDVAASRIYAQEDFSPYARVRDRRVERSLPLTLTPGTMVHHPRTVLKDDGSPYTVYTPFSRTWRSLELPALVPSPPAQIPTPEGIAGEPLPTSDTPPTFAAGEAAAQDILTAFTGGEAPPVFRYAEDRNRVDLSGTSGLSPYLRFGMISAVRAVHAALDAAQKAPDKASAKGAEVWLNELIWREFFIAILYHFPHVRRRSFREAYRSIDWANDEADFEAWCKGRTGYPLVDAAMRQLAQTGWMHNRARMVTASFLTKDLLIDWRWGEEWFMQHLVDGDPASNNGGWQWSAGTGTDAAPYFRIFNPVSQSERHDPEGTYIRKFVPELRQVPDQYIHEPWKMPENVQKEADCVLGQTYPKPIVDHHWARERALAAFKQAKD
jgi:deoxyribodipyrimidine photo-lyase